MFVMKWYFKWSNNHHTAPKKRFVVQREMSLDFKISKKTAMLMKFIDLQSHWLHYNKAWWKTQEYKLLKLWAKILKYIILLKLEAESMFLILCI